RETYNATGQVLTRKVYEPDGTTLIFSETNVYDRAGNRVETIDGDNNATYFTYNGAGEVVGTQVYQRNPDQSLTLVSSEGEHFDLAGFEDRTVDGNGNITHLTYNADGQVLTKKVYQSDDTTLVSSLTNHYDLAENLD